MSQAAVDAAGAAVREAETHLSHCTIASPIAGRVISRMADVGDIATQGKPLMMIYDPSTLRLEVSVAEHLRGNVNLGERVRASIDAFEFDGEIEEIVPASDPSSRSFTARVSIPAGKDFYPGMYGRIHLAMGSAEVVLIPPAAVLHVGQLEMVTVVEDGAARRRTIKTGKRHTEGIEVLSGLQAGETIVLP
jgi:RND family efflux transporter MFP subunit